jgi:ribosome-binding factor A
VKEYPRKARLDTQIQHELAEIIRDELSDPRVQGVTVTRADVAPDLRNATVKVSVLGTDDELKAAVAGLKHASGKLRHELGRRLRLRLVPTLHFSADTQLREADRISELIRNAVRQDQRSHERGK